MKSKSRRDRYACENIKREIRKFCFVRRKFITEGREKRNFGRNRLPSAIVYRRVKIPDRVTIYYRPRISDIPTAKVHRLSACFIRFFIIRYDCGINRKKVFFFFFYG